MIRLYIILTVNALFWAFLQAHAQSKEKVIEEVRQRYYRINGANVTLTKTTIDATDYWLENNHVVIAKQRVANGTFEYYYDVHDGEYYPYFIYFASEDPNKNPDIRAYYGEDSRLVSYKENQQELEVIDFNHYYYYLALDAANTINKWLNEVESVDALQEEQSRSVLKKIEQLKKSIVQVDTLEADEYDDDGGSVVLNYRDVAGRIVKHSSSVYGEHGSQSEIVYYDDKGLVLSIEEDEGWVGSYTSVSVQLTYYENEQAFRIDTYKSHGVHPGTQEDDSSDLVFSLESMVPRVKYMKK